MTHSRALTILTGTLLALLVPTTSASAAPARYELEGEGCSGWVELGEAGKTLITRRVNRFRVQLAVSSPARRLRLSGTVRTRGQELKGTLRETPGLIGGLKRRAKGKRWRVTITPQGLRLKVQLSRRKVTLRLRGRAALGKRNRANEQVIRAFYQAFQRKDAAGMARSYAPNVHFTDMIFPNLKGDEARSMWAMLCQSEDLVLTFSCIRAGDRHGVAHWEATYELFGNRIHNVIEASFVLEDGKIVRHVDWFDFGRWVKQALPGPSRFLAERALVRSVRLASKVQLMSFMRKQNKASTSK